MRKILYVFLIVSALLAACGPTVAPNSTSSGHQATTVEKTPQVVTTALVPEAVPAPSATEFSIPRTPTPEMYISMPEVADTLGNCNGQEFSWGSEHTIQACNGWNLKNGIMPPDSFLAVSSVGYALSAAEIAAAGGKVVGVVTTGSKTIGFIVVIAKAALPVAVVSGVIALPILAVIDLAQNPRTASDPLIQDWLAHRYPPVVLPMTQDKVGVIDIPEGFVTNSWPKLEKAYRVPNGTTAIILEDDVLLATTTAVALRNMRFTIVGIFPSCESWMASGLVATLFTVDNYMLKYGMKGIDCAPIIAQRAPAAIIIPHSAAHPDNDPTSSGESLRELFQKAASPTNIIGGAQKTRDLLPLVREIMRIFGG